MNFLAFGNHTVRNLLHSPYFIFKKVLLREEHKNDQELLQLLEQKKIVYQILDKEQFARYGFGKKNQGIGIFIKDYSYVSLFHLLKIRPQRKFPLLIILNCLEDPHNFGAILRTAAALAIDGIIIPTKNQVPINSSVVRVSHGGVAYLPVCQVDNLTWAINKLKEENYKIIATVCETSALPYKQLAINAPTAIIFGNEHEGISPSLIKKSDYLCTIPLSNSIPSLNVSVSAGIILAHLIQTL